MLSKITVKYYLPYSQMFHATSFFKKNKEQK